jgi:hypothetical protein
MGEKLSEKRFHLTPPKNLPRMWEVSTTEETIPQLTEW